MVDGGRRCELPGCGAPIEIVPGRPERRYCTAAHRAAARQARRLSGNAAAQARLAEALPWVHRPDPEPDLVLAGAPANTSALAGPAVAPPVDLWSPHPGAAHVPAQRPSAPSDLGSSGPSALGPSDLGWLYEPPAPSRGPRLRIPRPSISLRLPALSRPRRPSWPAWTAGSARRRRTLAALGAAGLILAGYSITASEPEPGATSAAALAVPEFTDQQQWADRATIALTSVDSQLVALAESEVAWGLLPDAVKASRPDVLARLLDRKAFLEAQKALLQSQLANFASLRSSADGLRETEQQLARVQRTLELARANGADGPAVSLATARDGLVAVRDAERREMESRAAAVDAGTRAPLPDDGAPTAQVTGDVTALKNDAGPLPAPADTLPEPRPVAVAGREESGNPGGQVGVSGPPDPRGPGDRSPRAESGSGSSDDATDSQDTGSSADSSPEPEPEPEPAPHRSTPADPYLPQGSESFSDQVVQNIDEERADRGYGPLGS